LITGAVDGELTQEEKRFLSLHLEGCAGCRSEYDSEVSLKTFLRETMVGHHAPADLLRAVSDDLRGQVVRSESWVDRWKAALSAPFARPALALGLTVVLAVIFLTGQPSNDIIDQSLARYELTAQETFAVQYAATEPAMLRAFFESKTDFPVLIPDMKDCKLLGGILEENPSGAVAEVLYDHGSQRIFLSQTAWSSIGKEGSVSMENDVRDQLMRENVFIQTMAEGNSVVLWKKGNTLCAAVSEMSSDDLIYCLTSGDPDLLSQD
jgi:anti-sigma factor RsiW